MSETFESGDHARWNADAGRVTGTIRKVHTRDFRGKGHSWHCSKDDPQYEIESAKTEHLAVHTGGALEKVD